MLLSLGGQEPGRKPRAEGRFEDSTAPNSFVPPPSWLLSSFKKCPAYSNFILHIFICKTMVLMCEGSFVLKHIE